MLQLRNRSEEEKPEVKAEEKAENTTEASEKKADAELGFKEETCMAF